MTRFVYRATSLDDTDRLGSVLAAAVPDGTTIALCGTLGSGKTRLVQSIAAACGICREHVVSPTFVLCQEYHGSRDLYHLDVYRLADDREFWELGPEEYFESSGLTLIEWADRVESCLPESRLTVEIEVLSELVRDFKISAMGDPRWPEMVASIRAQLECQ